eukprot:gene10329-2745_t
MRKIEENKIPKQPFDYYLFLDFEANCQEGDSDFFREIIEFPIIMLNSKTLKIEKEYQQFVKPTVNRNITEFCTKLTGITQKKVDSAVTLQKALENVDDFLKNNDLLSGKYSFIFVTDGPWDFRDFLAPECQKKKIPYPQYFDQWVNIRKLFGQFYKTKPMGIKKMVLKLNLDFIGIAHQGIDDSKNIANIGIQIIKDGGILKKNGCLKDYEIKSMK